LQGRSEMQGVAFLKTNLKKGGDTQVAGKGLCRRVSCGKRDKNQGIQADETSSFMMRENFSSKGGFCEKGEGGSLSRLRQKHKDCKEGGREALD